MNPIILLVGAIGGVVIAALAQKKKPVNSDLIAPAPPAPVATTVPTSAQSGATVPTGELTPQPNSENSQT